MKDSTRVVLLALPLMERSGVYRSAHDLVRAATDDGLAWSAVLGVRPTASGTPLSTPGVRETEFAPHGSGTLSLVRQIIDESPEVARADVVITLISQTDIAFRRTRSRTGRTWIAWVRGKPWPAAGEQNLLRRVLLRALEARALRAADEVWATTPVLAAEFEDVLKAAIVPAGIGNVKRVSWGTNGHSPMVWAGRLDVDKRPELFAEVVRVTGHPGRVYGDGPMSVELKRANTPGVSWAGWADAERLWDDASVFVGTSAREAFGRSAVEAAAAGLPIVIGSDYGAAPLLVTSEDLRRVCVIDSADPNVWAASVQQILGDNELRTALSNHVHANAQRLTIASSVRSASHRIKHLRMSMGIS